MRPGENHPHTGTRPVAARNDVAASVVSRARPSASASPKPAARSRDAIASVVIDAATDLAAKAAGAHVLNEQRTRPVLLPHASVQVLEDAQPRVETDEIDQLEGAHRVIQSEPQ